MQLQRKTVIYYCMKRKISKYQKRKKIKARFVVGAFVLFLVGCFCYVYFVSNPVVVEATRHAVYSLSTTAVSDAIYDVLQEENLTYNDLVDVKFDQNGNVELISLQTVKLNKISRRFYQVAQEYLDHMGDQGLDVALGTFTGIPFLSGVGPKINLKLASIGAMTSVFESEFRTAGINQTAHSLYIRLYASVSMLLPAYTSVVDSVTEMLVAENIIVGEIPSVYLRGNSSLNFSP